MILRLLSHFLVLACQLSFGGADPVLPTKGEEEANNRNRMISLIASYHSRLGEPLTLSSPTLTPEMVNFGLSQKDWAEPADLKVYQKMLSDFVVNGFKNKDEKLLQQLSSTALTTVMGHLNERDAFYAERIEKLRNSQMGKELMEDPFRMDLSTPTRNYNVPTMDSGKGHKSILDE